MEEVVSISFHLRIQWNIQPAVLLFLHTTVNTWLKALQNILEFLICKLFLMNLGRGEINLVLCLIHQPNYLSSIVAVGIMVPTLWNESHFSLFWKTLLNCFSSIKLWWISLLKNYGIFLSLISPTYIYHLNFSIGRMDKILD